MITTERTITICGNKSKIDEPILLYRGDFEVEVKFKIFDSKYKFQNGLNLLAVENAAYGQLAILGPNGGNVFSGVTKCLDGIVSFLITETMIDELKEVGKYSFQIRLFDANKTSRVTIPPVEFGLIVGEPVASEDTTEKVDEGVVGYSIARATNVNEETVGDTFDEDGDYNKTNWVVGDRITADKLNKIEDAIDVVNRNDLTSANALRLNINANYNDLQRQINSIIVESGDTDSEIAQARGEHYVLNDRLNDIESKIINNSTQLSDVENDVNVLQQKNINKSNLTQKNSITDITFIRKNATRNFYNLTKPICEINMDTDIFVENGNLYPFKNVAGDEMLISQVGKTVKFENPTSNTELSEGYLSVGEFHPYATYDFTIDEINGKSYRSNAIIEFHSPGESQRIMVIRRNASGQNDLAINVQNGDEFTENLVVPYDTAFPCELRIQFTGQRIHLFQIVNKRHHLLKSLDLSGLELRKRETYRKFKCRVGARLDVGNNVIISKAKGMFTCGTGQADPRPFQYENGSPIISNGKVYFCMTTRGFSEIKDSYQGIYSLELNTMKWSLEGSIFFEIYNDGIDRQFHASTVVYDRKSSQWLVMTTGHGYAPKIYKGTSNADLRGGIHTIKVSELSYPNVNTLSSEDTSLVFDENRKKWMLALVQSDSTGARFKTLLCQSDEWDGEYMLVSQTNRDNETGVFIQKINGEYVVMCGDPNGYPVYSYPNLSYLGELNMDVTDGGFRGWACVFPINIGTYTTYYWITFDRSRPTGTYSYGSLYIYQSNVDNVGSEYDNHYLNI